MKNTHLTLGRKREPELCGAKLSGLNLRCTGLGDAKLFLSFSSFCKLSTVLKNQKIASRYKCAPKLGEMSELRSELTKRVPTQEKVAC